MPDRYNGDSASAAQKEAAEAAAQLLRAYRGLCISLVWLPKEDRAQLTTTVSYLKPGALLNSTMFVRRSTGEFEYDPSRPGAGEGLLCDAMYFLASQPAGRPRLLYWGQVMTRKEALSAPSDGGLSICVAGKWGADLGPFGGVALKLNHTCGATQIGCKLVHGVSCGNGRRVSAKLLEPPVGAPPLQAHEELVWDYRASCVDPADELVCTCNSAKCDRLLCRYDKRVGPVVVCEGRKRRPVADGVDWTRFLERARKVAKSGC
ncbi:hypothetical protein HYH03_010107 [Edaphochlamys debaryana]|uniref:SET domain-containing protein n=1 Tax=Edaphochlamys debaryana TaxID=47281 RepID=A0A835XWL3_9CHLO|nr:hypothetical protein HYH03_010107 [Edaphochlamys debaryana]|eukprot:KAG2491536.1 hypothetical protein HYH03_010107 [Edaphochlamys debaryana]